MAQFDPSSYGNSNDSRNARGALFELFGRSFLAAEAANKSERDHRVLRHVERHRERRVAFDEGVRGEFGVGVALGPLFKTFQIEVLVLKRVGQLMGHHGLLTFQLDPVGEVKLLRLRIVVAGDLFGK